MTHCRRCRADAVGLLGEGISSTMQQALTRAAGGPIEPEQQRPYAAVATLEGMLINQHLGEAKELSIFAPDESAGGFRLLERRRAPAAGGGTQRWLKLGETLGDCRVLLCSSAGQTPLETLAGTGLKVLMTEGLIDQALNDVYAGRPPAVSLCAKPCGSGCSGDGMGCL
jgi:nitrogen fixation protein NifB